MRTSWRGWSALLDERTALIVRGPRGCGVSALLDAATARAAARGVGVLRAGAAWRPSRASRTPALHQLLRPLRRAVAGAGRASRARRCGRRSGSATRGVPDPASVAAALVALARRRRARARVRRRLAVGRRRDPRRARRRSSRATSACRCCSAGTASGRTVSRSCRCGRWTRSRRRRAARRRSCRCWCASGSCARRPGGRWRCASCRAAYAGAGDGELLGSWAPLTPALEEAFADGLERAGRRRARRPCSWPRWTTAGGCRTSVAAASRLAGRALSADVFAPAVALRAGRARRRPVGVRASADARGGPARVEPGGAGGGPRGVRVRRRRDATPTARPGTASSARPGLDAGARRRAGGGRAALPRRPVTTSAPPPGLRRAANLTPAGPERSRRLVAAAELAYEIGGIEVADRLLEEVVPEHLDAAGRARGWSRCARASRPGVAGRRGPRDCPDPELALRLRWRAATELQAVGGDGAAIAREADARARRGDPRRPSRSAPTGVPRSAHVVRALDFPGQRREIEHSRGRSRRALVARLRRARLRRRARSPRRCSTGPRTSCARSGGGRGSGRCSRSSARAQLGVSASIGRGPTGRRPRGCAREVRQPLWGALARTALATVAALRGDEEEAERHAADGRARRAARSRRVRARGRAAGTRRARAGRGRPAEAFAHLQRPVRPDRPGVRSRDRGDAARRPRRGGDDRGRARDGPPPADRRAGPSALGPGPRARRARARRRR